MSSFAVCHNGLLRMPVAMVPPPRGGLAFEMVFEFGVENTLGKRLLQLVEKPVFVENLFRVTAVQKLVQGVCLDRHKRLRRRHYGPAHKIPDSSPAAQRRVSRRFRPSSHPSSLSSRLMTTRRACPSGSASPRPPMRTPTWRMAACCAGAGADHAAPALPSRTRTSRRLIRSSSRLAPPLENLPRTRYATEPIGATAERRRRTPFSTVSSRVQRTHASRFCARLAQRSARALLGLSIGLLPTSGEVLVTRREFFRLSRSESAIRRGLACAGEDIA